MEVKSMNKKELVQAIVTDSQVSKKDVEKVVESFTKVVSESLRDGDKVQLVGFGTFELSERAEREGRNPKTGATMKIPASRSPKFKPGKALKDLVNK